ncbi:MAG TPA: flagellar filament outer layer protein FlaA, partial [Treponemataceae bacterium]|nr:flagellar filament outer layer protein FlaA [Treponemataceae bacterium]
LKVIGFRVDCDPELARGSYYLYFDDLRAVTDLYAMENRDEDDMDDNW